MGSSRPVSRAFPFESDNAPSTRLNGALIEIFGRTLLPGPPVCVTLTNEPSTDSISERTGNRYSMIGPLPAAISPVPDVLIRIPVNTSESGFASKVWVSAETLLVRVLV